MLGLARDLGRWHLAALLLGGLLRAIHAARISPPDALSGWDGAEYLAYARALAAFQGDDYARFADTVRPPGYPLFIIPFLMLGREAWIIRALQAAQLLLGLMTCLVLRDLTRRWRGRGAGDVAFALLLFNPLIWYYGGYVLTEGVFMALLWGGMACLLRLAEPGADCHRCSVWSGVLLGAGCLVRPTLLLFLPLAAGWAFVHGWAGSRPWRKAVGVAASFTVVSCALVSPWLVGHRIVHGELTLSPRTAAFVHSFANAPEYLGMYEATSREDYYRLQDALSRRFMVGKGGPEVWLAEAERFRRERPREWRRLQLYKALHFWRPWVNPLLFPASRVALSAAFTVPVFALALFELLRSRWALGRFGALLLALIGIGWLVGGVLYHVQLRYRIPYVDVACTVLAAAAAAGVMDMYRRRGARRPTTPGC